MNVDAFKVLANYRCWSLCTGCAKNRNEDLNLNTYFVKLADKIPGVGPRDFK
jgi:hypothetical protein